MFLPGASRLEAGMSKRAVALGAAIAAVASSPAAAQNYTLSVQYFTVTPGGDFQSECCSTVGDLVQSQLGPNGLPVYNPSSSNPWTLVDLDSNGELTWWSPTLDRKSTRLNSSHPSISYA